MPARKSPQLLKDKVIGARFTPHETAAITVLAAGRPNGTWVRQVVLEAIEKARQDGTL